MASYSKTLASLPTWDENTWSTETAHHGTAGAYSGTKLVVVAPAGWPAGIGIAVRVCVLAIHCKTTH